MFYNKYGKEEKLYSLSNKTKTFWEYNSKNKLVLNPHYSC